MIHVSICENKGIYEKNKKKARRNSGLYVSHTLTLGQALMLAGLSVEGRFLCRACGPRRAWLKNYYIYCLSWIIVELLGGVRIPFQGATSMWKDDRKTRGSQRRRSTTSGYSMKSTD